MPEPFRLVIEIPGLRVNTVGNNRVHWRQEAKTAREHRLATQAACSHVSKEARERLLQAKRLRVKYVRIGVRKLDMTNCVGAFKHVQDQMAAWLGVDDKSEWYSWQWPDQVKDKTYGVRIELETEDA